VRGTRHQDKHACGPGGRVSQLGFEWGVGARGAALRRAGTLSLLHFGRVARFVAPVIPFSVKYCYMAACVAYTGITLLTAEPMAAALFPVQAWLHGRPPFPAFIHGSLAHNLRQTLLLPPPHRHHRPLAETHWIVWVTPTHALQCTQDTVVGAAEAFGADAVRSPTGRRAMNIRGFWLTVLTTAVTTAAFGGGTVIVYVRNSCSCSCESFRCWRCGAGAAGQCSPYVLSIHPCVETLPPPRYNARHTLSGFPLFAVRGEDFYKLGIVLLLYAPQFIVLKVLGLPSTFGRGGFPSTPIPPHLASSPPPPSAPPPGPSPPRALTAVVVRV
jgi:hypothetical protein